MGERRTCVRGRKQGGNNGVFSTVWRTSQYVTFVNVKMRLHLLHWKMQFFADVVPFERAEFTMMRMKIVVSRWWEFSARIYGKGICSCALRFALLLVFIDSVILFEYFFFFFNTFNRWSFKDEYLMKILMKKNGAIRYFVKNLARTTFISKFFSYFH